MLKILIRGFILGTIPVTLMLSILFLSMSTYYLDKWLIEKRTTLLVLINLFLLIISVCGCYPALCLLSSI